MWPRWSGDHEDPKSQRWRSKHTWIRLWRNTGAEIKSAWLWLSQDVRSAPESQGECDEHKYTRRVWSAMSEARAKIARVLISVAVRVQSVSVRHTHTSQSKWGWAGRLTARGRSRRPRPVHQLNLQMRELSQTKHVKIWKWQMCEGAVVRFTWCNVNGEAMRRPGLTGGQSLGLRMKEG